MTKQVWRFIYWVSGGRLVHRDNIPRGRIIVPAGGTFKIRGVRFENVQLEVQEDSNYEIEGCYFDMREMTVLGLDFVTIAAKLEKVVTDVSFEETKGDPLSEVGKPFEPGARPQGA